MTLGLRLGHDHCWRFHVRRTYAEVVHAQNLSHKENQHLLWFSLRHLTFSEWIHTQNGPRWGEFILSLLHFQVALVMRVHALVQLWSGKIKIKAVQYQGGPRRGVPGSGRCTYSQEVHAQEGLWLGKFINRAVQIPEGPCLWRGYLEAIVPGLLSGGSTLWGSFLRQFSSSV